jgi:hypothetical protein
MKSPEKLYEFHVANVRAVDDALKRISLAARQAIAAEKIKTLNAFIRTYVLLLAAWAECRLRKLLYEPDAFMEAHRNLILSQSTELERWSRTIELAFRNHYEVPNADLSVETLPHSVYSQYETINELVNSDLSPVILLRNKLAHGQWAFPLNESGDDVAQKQHDALRTENLLSLQLKKKLLDSLAAIIHDLVVSKPTFERDFDSHFSHIINARINLRTRSYQKYAASLREKLQRGMDRKQAP